MFLIFQLGGGPSAPSEQGGMGGGMGGGFGGLSDIFGFHSSTFFTPPAEVSNLELGIAVKNHCTMMSCGCFIFFLYF